MRLKLGASGANFISLRVGRLRPCRPQKSPQDFGDDDTIGTPVRRVGRRGHGIFLGCHSGMWVVGVTRMGGHEFSKTEVFSSPAHLRKEWAIEEGHYG